MRSKLIGFLTRGSEAREARKLDKLTSEDLLSIEPERKYTVVQTTDYGISKIGPEIDERSAKKLITDQVIQDNVSDVSYEIRVRKSDTENRTMTITPKSNEIRINKVQLVHVPIWDVEFESGDKTYARKVLASSDRVVLDEISICPEHFSFGKINIIKRATKAACEMCGQVYCENHITYAGNIYYCGEHLPEQYRTAPEKKSKFGFKSLFGTKE